MLCKLTFSSSLLFSISPLDIFHLLSRREAVLVRSLRRLREQIVRANLLVQEACFISDELERHTEYRVTLQIPADNLNANRKVSHMKMSASYVSVVIRRSCSPESKCICVCVCRGMQCSVNQRFRSDDGVEGNRSGVWRRWTTVWWT